jgi:hypothetical protein
MLKSSHFDLTGQFVSRNEAVLEAFYDSAILIVEGKKENS